MRDPEAALSRAPPPHSRRADVGVDAAGGGRDAGLAARHGAPPGDQHPDDHAQIPRGDGVRRRGHDPPSRARRRSRPGRRAHARRDGAQHDRRRGADAVAGAERRIRSGAARDRPARGARRRGPAGGARLDALPCVRARSSASPAFPATASASSSKCWRDSARPKAAPSASPAMPITARARRCAATTSPACRRSRSRTPASRA